ncbi:MAG: hypothetical protein JW873_02195 [Candidatus Saganbacteria bacterium]|nr:hypothetical protein [Candidatus Saganbacteria bacterium]
MGIISGLGRYLGIGRPPVIHSDVPRPLPGESEKNFIKRMIPKQRIVNLKANSSGSVVSVHLFRAEDKDLPHLKYLPSITRLVLESGQITDQGVPDVAVLTTLTHLDLVGCMHLTNNGLGPLVSLNQLQKLDLGGTFIGDGGVPFIIKIIAGSHVAELDLTCSKVSHTGTEKIYARFPGLHIHHPYYD